MNVLNPPQCQRRPSTLGGGALRTFLLRDFCLVFESKQIAEERLVAGFLPESGEASVPLSINIDGAMLDSGDMRIAGATGPATMGAAGISTDSTSAGAASADAASAGAASTGAASAGAASAGAASAGAASAGAVSAFVSCCSCSLLASLLRSAVVVTNEFEPTSSNLNSP